MPCPSVTRGRATPRTPITQREHERDRAEHDVLEVHGAGAVQPRHVHRGRNRDERVAVGQRDAAEHERDREDAEVVRAEQADQDEIEREVKAALHPLAAEREDEVADRPDEVAGMATPARDRARRALRRSRSGARARSPGTGARWPARRMSPRSARARRRRSRASRPGCATISRERARERRRVVRRDDPAADAVLDDLGQAADARDQRRAAMRHRLDRDAAERLRQARRHGDDIGPAVERRGIGAGTARSGRRTRGRRRAPPRAAPPRARGRSRTSRRRCAPRAAARVARQQRQCFDQQVLPLDAVDAAEHQQPQRARAVIVARRAYFRRRDAVVDDMLRRAAGSA